MSIRISYLLTTYNKKKYIKITLPYLIEQLKENEEIVIFDGGSTDGTVDFIKNTIFNKKNILFISEKDCGEAHGLNKCILNANGTYLKIISDDDAYHFGSIRNACDWLDQNTNYDWVGSNGFSAYINNDILNFNFKNEEPYYINYKKKHIPFLLTGLSYLIRKKSISKMGLFNISYKIVDFEYSLRNLSNTNIKFALSKQPFYVNIINPDSNSLKFYKKLMNEYFLLQNIYIPRRILNNSIWYFKNYLSFIYKKIIGNKKNTQITDFAELYHKSILLLNDNNLNKPFEIIFNEG